MQLSQQESPEGWVIWSNRDTGPWYARRDHPVTYSLEQAGQGLAATLVEDDLDALRGKIEEQEALEQALGVNTAAP